MIVKRLMFFVLVCSLCSCNRDSNAHVENNVASHKPKQVEIQKPKNLHLKKAMDSLDSLKPEKSYYLFDLNDDSLKELMVYDKSACALDSNCSYEILQYDQLKDAYKIIGKLKGAFRYNIPGPNGYKTITTVVTLDGSKYKSFHYAFQNGMYHAVKSVLVEFKNGKQIETPIPVE
ncbi:hypothetical protein [uncultured Psychroserpens sp.]|uniref:hypothetical protein n=1 Tax=uncultured Psychroserpens sp. TaxID=255436 RepID=UPI002625736F|nr:hypothetical protein [uncultured Psychroserpens sp.]